MDSEIIRALGRWAKHRHPNKSKGWIKKRYFRVTEQGRDWCFFGQKNGRKATLLRAMDVPIKRHIKVRGEANPYDPQWEMYFERRQERKMSQALKGRGKVFYLWQKQNGKCPVCRQPFTEQSGWHKHHIIWKVHGGDEGSDNLVLLHPNCHRQVHSRKLKVEKPGS
jgi:RNA-directed DNA polymerase